MCDGESVYESRNRASINLRNEITALVDEGRLSDDEILADLRRTYDEKILLVPQASAPTRSCGRCPWRRSSLPRPA